MIPAEVIAEIRARHELVAFIESNGIQLRRRGADYVGKCPFHANGAERTASLVISPRKQLWCCHGACSADGKRTGGDVIEFAQRLWGLTFPETVARLRPNGSAPPEGASLPEAAKEKGTLAPALLERLANYYAQNLARSQEAQKYLQSRGIARSELLVALQVGFSDGSLIETMSEASPIRKELTAAGLITAAGSEFFFRCVVLPLLDLAGVVVGMYGRGIDGDRHLYLPGPRRGLVNAACAATTDEIIITESVIDAMSFLEAGIPNAIPIYGVNGWTSDHDDLLEKHRIRRVVLALDSDDAGQKASAAIGAKLLARAIDITNVVFPAKDANEMLTGLGADGFASEWKKLVRSAASTQTGSSAPAESLPEAAKEEDDAAQHTAVPSPAEAPAAASEPSSAPAESPEAAKEKDESQASPSQPIASLAQEDGAYVLCFEKRRYLIRGLVAIGVDRLRVNVRAEQEGRFHVDTLDLYSARARRGFIEDLTETLGAAADQQSLQREMACLIEALERERLQLRSRGKSSTCEKKAMTPSDRDEAMEFLISPSLLTILRADFIACGCIGEETAMLTSYLAIVSRLLPDPLAILSCARSGAGKSTLQERSTDFVPAELLIKLTRITGQALFYRDEHALVNKVLAVDEEEGAAEAAYALRCLQSAGYLSVSSTRTDPHTGRQHAEDYRVYGPTAIFLTTAHPEALDYETRNRFVILTVDESKEQTRRILDLQRRNDTLDGLVALEGRKAILRRHHNAQRLLQPLRVVNPFARELVYPTDRLILRREHKKYLTLIKAIALLHQFQRERKRSDAHEYIEVRREDIELAQTLAPLILRRSLDELAPPTRSLLVEIRCLVLAKMAAQKVPQHHAVVDRREIQAATGLSSWHLREYLQQLVEFEYLASVVGRKGSRYVYELLWDGMEEDLESVLRK